MRKAGERNEFMLKHLRRINSSICGLTNCEQLPLTTRQPRKLLLHAVGGGGGGPGWWRRRRTTANRTRSVILFAFVAVDSSFNSFNRCSSETENESHYYAITCRTNDFGIGNHDDDDSIERDDENNGRSGEHQQWGITNWLRKVWGSFRGRLGWRFEGEWIVKYDMVFGKRDVGNGFYIHNCPRSAEIWQLESMCILRGMKMWREICFYAETARRI